MRHIMYILAESLFVFLMGIFAGWVTTIHIGLLLTVIFIILAGFLSFVFFYIFGDIFHNAIELDIPAFLFLTGVMIAGSTVATELLVVLLVALVFVLMAVVSEYGTYR